MPTEAPRKPRSWTVTTMGHCHICRTETPQVIKRTLYPNGRQQSETTCDTCGAVVSRNTVTLGSWRGP